MDGIPCTSPFILSPGVLKRSLSYIWSLQWDSQHHLSARYSVINTLTHRAKTVCNKPELFQRKWTTSERHSINASTPNGLWTGWEEDSHNLPARRVTMPTPSTLLVPSPPSIQTITKGHIVIAYTQGLCKSIKKICSKYGIQTHFKGNKTIKNILVSPKDKDPIENKNGAIYWF